MFTVLIYGAGSIGNHLAFACKSKGWDVTICDTDIEALKRTKEEIYPERYGCWDESIKLVTADKAPAHRNIVIIGTPPDTHIDIAIDVLTRNPPDILLIEKPLSKPSFSPNDGFIDLVTKVKTKVLVGYNHNLTSNTLRAVELIQNGILGEPISINIRWQEHWGGIFKAHPWLNGPSESYLGYWDRGGGACCEHSHGINLWLRFADLLRFGKVKEVSATMDMWEHNGGCYDRGAYINLVTESGLVGSIIQDVVTTSPQKFMKIQGTDGYLEWFAGFDDGHDAVRYANTDGEAIVELITRIRPDDFIGEIDHLEDLVINSLENSPISLENGLETMQVISAAHESHREKRVTRINEI